MATSPPARSPRRFLGGLIAAGMLLAVFSPPLPAQGLAGVSLKVQPKMAKIYGAGGIQGLESYQSGFLVSGDGHILTVWSYVLDTEFITTILRKNSCLPFQRRISEP